MRILLKGFRGIDFERLKIEYLLPKFETAVSCSKGGLRGEVKGFERGFCGFWRN